MDNLQSHISFENCKKNNMPFPYGTQRQADNSFHMERKKGKASKKVNKPH
jgi:hypothetical protein